jgi:citrate lyase subunit beta / citryl-CoA lyase
MPSIIRPRRSVLFMPGSNARALEKAKTLPADALIFDLEDAVAPDAKETARQMVCHAMRAGGYGKRELIVRVNALATPWGDADFSAVAICGADAILLPKVESGDMVRQALSLLSAHGAPESLAIWCMIETPRGVLRAEDIAVSPRVAALVMGTSDLTKELHARHSRERLPMLPSLGWCVLVGRAYGLTVLDGVHLDLNDDEGFEYACRQAADMGFDGKTLIHPKTIWKSLKRWSCAEQASQVRRWHSPSSSPHPRLPYCRAVAWATWAISSTCSRCPTMVMIAPACTASMTAAVKRRNLSQISSHVNGFRGEPLCGLVGRV